MFESWEGKRVLVTGASFGIGAAIARDLAAVGAVVGICARRTELLEEVLADCRRSVPECQAWTIDLSDLGAIDGFVHRVEEELGGIDVLVNNAAHSLHGDALMVPWSDVEYGLRINYLAPIRVTHAALPAMLTRGSGRVVTVSSMAARTSPPGEAAFAASKAALATYIEALAGELWGSPVRFHLVYPALTDVTPGVDGDDELAVSSNGMVPIPAAVLARAVRAQVERGDLELYAPVTMAGFFAGRAADIAGSVELMAAWYQSQQAAQPEQGRS